MKATLKIAFWLVLAMFVSSMFGGSIWGMVDRSMALQGGYRGYYPLSVRLHRLRAFCGRPFRFSLLAINTLITKHYERNNRIFLLSLLRRSDGDLFPPCKHHSFCRW